jgi:hypothetical protein
VWFYALLRRALPCTFLALVAACSGDDAPAGPGGSGGASSGSSSGAETELSVRVVGLGSVTSEPGGIDCGETCAASFAQGSDVVLTAKPRAGAAFVRWSGACADADRDPQATVRLSSDAACTATFTMGGGGPSHARLAASREVIREPADDAPASDSETRLSADVASRVASWSWEVRRADTGALVFSSDEATPTFTCPASGRGAYDVALEIDGAERFLARRLVTCTLPRTDAGRTVHAADLDEQSYLSAGRVNGVVVQPGDVVRLKGQITKNLVLFNFVGTEEAPIHLINDGLVTVTDAGKLLHLVNCRHVILDGLGDDAHPYGIVLADTRVPAAGSQALFMRNYTEGTSQSLGLTDIEIFGVHVKANTGGAGIQADTAGSAAFNRDSWEFDHLSVHHNLVEDTLNEGFYIGHTRDWLSDDVETHLAYQIRGAKLYRNTIRRTGKDGLQVCNAVADLEVHDNHVSEVATKRMSGHTSSFQYNSGSSGHVYNNQFLGGSGVNMQVGCTGGDTWFFDNVVDRGDFEGGGVVYIIAGRSSGVEYHFFGNTFRARGASGILLNADSAAACDGGPTGPEAFDGLYAVNNVFVFPDGEIDDKLPEVFRFDSPMNVAPTLVTEPNVWRLEPDIEELCFADEAAADYRITCEGSPALAGDGAALDTVGSLSAAALPLGAFTDATGQVFADPRNHGAYQTLSR